MKKISTIVAIIVATVVAIIVGVCAVGPATFQQSGTTQQDEEVEDCDAEDWINREDDCGFVSPKPVKTSAPKVTPKTRATRR